MGDNDDAVKTKEEDYARNSIADCAAKARVSLREGIKNTLGGCVIDEANKKHKEVVKVDQGLAMGVVVVL